MSQNFTASELEAFLDEALSPVEMAAIETALRDRPELIAQLASINRRRDAGIHSLSEIWRRRRVSCPTRDELGSYLLEALDEEHAAFIHFHIEASGCRWCAANLEDLKSRHDQADQQAAVRQRKYFESSAGYLRIEDE